ncbi:hypothetical protein D3C73_684230 [compost metagenome]
MQIYKELQGKTGDGGANEDIRGILKETDRELLVWLRCCCIGGWKPDIAVFSGDQRCGIRAFADSTAALIHDYGYNGNKCVYEAD